ncbi:MAG: hypothetical protein HGJ94_11910 [Desulfosarcina sp.]|nr:hypothetical protein [Desulfosarcina sp.]
MHPDTVIAGLGEPLKKSDLLKNRLRGIQANTSAKNPDESVWPRWFKLGDCLL